MQKKYIQTNFRKKIKIFRKFLGFNLREIIIKTFLRILQYFL